MRWKGVLGVPWCLGLRGPSLAKILRKKIQIHLTFNYLALYFEYYPGRLKNPLESSFDTLTHSAVLGIQCRREEYASKIDLD